MMIAHQIEEDHVPQLKVPKIYRSKLMQKTHYNQYQCYLSKLSPQLKQNSFQKSTIKLASKKLMSRTLKSSLHQRSKTQMSQSFLNKIDLWKDDLQKDPQEFRKTANDNFGLKLKSNQNFSKSLNKNKKKVNDIFVSLSFDDQQENIQFTRTGDPPLIKHKSKQTNEGVLRRLKTQTFEQNVIRNRLKINKKYSLKVQDNRTKTEADQPHQMERMNKSLVAFHSCLTAIRKKKQVDTKKNVKKQKKLVQQELNTNNLFVPSFIKSKVTPKTIDNLLRRIEGENKSKLTRERDANQNSERVFFKTGQGFTYEKKRNMTQTKIKSDIKKIVTQNDFQTEVNIECQTSEKPEKLNQNKQRSRNNKIGKIVKQTIIDQAEIKTISHLNQKQQQSQLNELNQQLIPDFHDNKYRKETYVINENQNGMKLYNDSLKTLQTRLLSRLKSSQEVTESQNKEKGVDGVKQFVGDMRLNQSQSQIILPNPHQSNPIIHEKQTRSDDIKSPKRKNSQMEKKEQCAIY